MTKSRVSLLAGVVFAALAAGITTIASHGNLVAPAAEAQNLGFRTISGAVLNSDSESVTGATVFLKNEKSKGIRSFTSAEKGHYHFAQVNMTDDYELWAEKDGKKSAVKTVSSWDARKEFVSDLKLK